MTTESLWQEITVAALLGTQRKPYQPPHVKGRLGALLHPPASPNDSPGEHAPDTSERHMLRIIAVTWLHRRAGHLPPRGAPDPVTACPPDARPRCSARASACLERILFGGLAGLLPEWLELANRHQVRVREELLPQVLEQCKNVFDQRSALLPALGERGQWLAARNPEWSGLVVRAEEHIWHEGQRRERLAFLSDLRARDPRRARELLAGTWVQDSPAERVTFLNVLAMSLNQEDEPFLESVLDDKRKDVRQSAALLLARLPESRLAQRAFKRIRPLLTWKNGLLRSTLEVSLPETCDEAMQRDGIEPRPPTGSVLGERAWWLAQNLALVPPRAWAAAWGKRPAAIFEVIRKSEWEAALLEGWSEAAVRQQDLEWLEALLAHEARRNDGKGLLTLFPRVPPATKEKLMLAMLRENPSLSYDSAASICLSACRYPWSLELTQSVTTTICWTLQKGELQPWRWEKLMRDIPAYFHPDLLETAIQRISTALDKREVNGVDPFARNLIAVLEFRLQMQRAFLSQPKEL